MAEAKNETANYHYKALCNNTTFFINKLYLFVSAYLPKEVLETSLRVNSIISIFGAYPFTGQ